VINLVRSFFTKANAILPQNPTTYEKETQAYYKAVCNGFISGLIDVDNLQINQSLRACTGIRIPWLS